MLRRTFFKNAGMAVGALTISPGFINLQNENRPGASFTDLHVHTTDKFTIDHLMDIGKARNVQFGIVEHPGNWAIKNDADLKQYIDHLWNYPVYIGLQPVGLGWSKQFSPELLSQIDYVLMDPQMVPKGNGETWQIWKFDTYVEDTEDFMARYMDYSMQVLEEEPLNIFGWPLFLPVCIARDYYKLWTEERMNQIITAAKKKNIAIEINDMSHTPHKEFIMKAKAAGLKFTFGSDSRNDNAGKLSYCRRIAKECNLRESDFFRPVRKL